MPGYGTNGFNGFYGPYGQPMNVPNPYAYYSGCGCNSGCNPCCG